MVFDYKIVVPTFKYVYLQLNFHEIHSTFQGFTFVKNRYEKQILTT